MKIRSINGLDRVGVGNTRLFQKKTKKANDQAKGQKENKPKKKTPPKAPKEGR